MNKYQEALDRLVKHSCPQRTSCNECDMKGYCNRIAKDWIDVLPELVDKATPKKPKGISITHDGRVGNCPNCNKLVRECDYKADICECGQALDWSDEDE